MSPPQQFFEILHYESVYHVYAMLSYLIRFLNLFNFLFLTIGSIKMPSTRTCNANGSAKDKKTKEKRPPMTSTKRSRKRRTESALDVLPLTLTTRCNLEAI